MGDTPAVTIIVCTSNRADNLRQTLAAIAQVCVPEQMPTELLVVDNASTDDTAEVVRSSRLPNISVRYIHEARRGKGYAYNRGMAEAQGDVFLFTDDDVRPPRNWIEGMCRPILAGEAEAVAGGVRLAPHLQRDWLRLSHRSVLASTERLDPLNPEELVGANMAFTRRVLEKVPQFDTALGPGALGFADETLFSFQLREAGYRIAAALDVEVEHHFQESRLLRASFLQTAEKMGRSNAHLNYHWHHGRRRIIFLHWLRLRLELKLWRARHRDEIRISEGISLEELRLVTLINFYGYMHSQKKKDRQYFKHGLVKRTQAVE